jgi:hypothetical protein
MSELNFVIDVSSGEDSDLKDFLRQHGVSASPNYGVQNAWPMPDVLGVAGVVLAAYLIYEYGFKQ